MPSLGGWEWVILAVPALLVIAGLPVLVIALIVRAVRKPKVPTVPERLEEIKAWREQEKIGQLEYEKMRKNILGIE